MSAQRGVQAQDPIEPYRALREFRPEPQRAERRHAEGELVVLTCRAPDPAQATRSGNQGGLVAVLAPVMTNRGGTWIGGRPIESPDVVMEAAGTGAEDALPYREVSVEYGMHLHDGFYNGLANGVLWPLYHSLLREVGPTRSPDWLAYRRVNELFARAAAQQARPGGFVWVHDYQLTLVPGLLREAVGESTTIGFFLHTPFPCPQILRTFRWAEELLRSMLAADVVGFQTEEYRRNFLDCVNVILGLRCDPERDEVAVGGRRVRVATVPVGADTEAIGHWLRTPAVRHSAARLRREFGGERLMLGVDRLDYTKGIDRRLEAVDMLLERYPDLRGRLTFVQIAVPSRLEIPAYQQLRLRVEQLAGHINARWSDGVWKPVKLLMRSYPLPELVAWYLAADVALVTPYQDGMNLVALEYCVTHADCRGALVLSERAGAAGALPEALTVNPYDLEDMVETLNKALRLSPQDARWRMERLHARARTHSAASWVAQFLALGRLSPHRSPTLMTYRDSPSESAP